MTIKTFGELEEGDIIIGSDGQPTTVVKAYEPHIPENMYLIEFDNGETIEASGNHLWYIETNLHRNLHKSRIRNAQKEFKNITKETEQQLYTMAEQTDNSETNIMEIAQLTQLDTNPNAMKEIIRIAESIGPVSEEKTILQDIATDEEMIQNTIRMYSQQKFSQQFLALKDKKYRKTHPVIIGEVVTTESLTHLAMDVNIPEIKPL